MKHIIMQAESIHGLLAKRKTQTRRTYGLEKINERPNAWRYDGLNSNGDHLFFDCSGAAVGVDVPDCIEVVRCPYGKPGEKLLVREALDLWPGSLTYDADGAPIEIRDWKWFDNHIRATCRPMFMPDWAGRFVLILESIRAERVASITEADCKCEGITGQIVKNYYTSEKYPNGFYLAYRQMWNEINATKPRLVKMNGKRIKMVFPFDASTKFASILSDVTICTNPWVWVISFNTEQIH